MLLCTGLYVHFVYGTYVFNCVHTLHFSVISKLNKGCSECSLFLSKLSNAICFQKHIDAFVKGFFMKTANGHSLIRGVLIQSCSARAKNFTNYVFCHPQFSGVIQNLENCWAILTPICLCRLLSK